MSLDRPSLSSLEKWPSLFFSLSLLFMIWISQHSIRVFRGAREGCRDSTFSLVLPSLQALHHPPVPFSSAPHCRLGNKAHCFSVLYACASPRAAPTCCACALLPRLGWGKREGRRDWWAGERPRGVFCNCPWASTFLVPFFSFFFCFPLPQSYIVSHDRDGRTFGVLGTPCFRGF